MQLDQYDNSFSREAVAISYNSSSNLTPENGSLDSSPTPNIPCISHATINSSGGKSRGPRNGRIHRRSPYNTSASQINLASVAEAEYLSQNSLVPATLIVDNISSGFSPELSVGNQFVSPIIYEERSANWSQSPQTVIRPTSSAYPFIYDAATYQTFCNDHDEEAKYRLAASPVLAHAHDAFPTYCQLDGFNSSTSTPEESHLLSPEEIQPDYNDLPHDSWGKCIVTLKNHQLRKL